MIVFATMVAAERITETLEHVTRAKNFNKFDRYVIVVNETKYNKLRDDHKKLLQEFGCEVYTRLWNDNFPDARNAYLEKCQNGDWVVVSDSDEHFCNDLLNNIDHITKEADDDGIGLLLINSHDIWYEDRLKTNKTKSDHYKNLIFRKNIDTYYIGVGETKNVHEELRLADSTKVKKLDDKYYYEHHKEVSEVWERATRNVFIGGGGNNVGDRNEEWVRLREICTEMGINEWADFKRHLEDVQIDKKLHDWIIKNRREGFDWENEMVDIFRWYRYLHPDRIPEGVKILTITNERAKIMQDVEQSYMKILGRHADQGGKEFYTQLIEKGKTKLH
ncbi:hypothetical protein LCGC14_2557450, partial [marine sediment metagenome]